MIMVKVNSNELRAAAKKLKGFVGESIILGFTMNPIKGTEKRYLKLTASNGIAQADIMASYEGDNETALTYFVGTSFAEIVETIGDFGDEFIIEPTETFLKVSCGTAAVPVPLLPDAMSMKMASLKDKEYLQVSVEKGKFSELIAHGGYAFGTDSRQPVFNGTVILIPCVDGEKRYLRAVSCSGTIVAGAVTDVEVKDDDKFLKFVESGKTQNVKVASLAVLAKRFASEKIELFFTDKQLIIRDGFDVYLLSVVEGDVPQPITALVTQKAEKKFSYNADASAFKKALTVATVTGAEKVTLAFEKESLAVIDAANGNRASITVTAEIEMEKKEEILFASALLKKVLDAMPNEVVIYVPTAGNALYIEGKDCTAFVLKIKSA